MHVLSLFCVLCAREGVCRLGVLPCGEPYKRFSGSARWRCITSQRIPLPTTDDAINELLNLTVLCASSCLMQHQTRLSCAEEKQNITVTGDAANTTESVGNATNTTNRTSTKPPAPKMKKIKVPETVRPYSTLLTHAVTWPFQVHSSPLSPLRPAHTRSSGGAPRLLCWSPPDGTSIMHRRVSITACRQRYHALVP